MGVLGIKVLLNMKPGNNSFQNNLFKVVFKIVSMSRVFIEFFKITMFLKIDFSQGVSMKSIIIFIENLKPSF